MPRALLSVSDKTGLIDLAHKLQSLNYELVSTGGTYQSLQEAGLPVTRVSEVTGFPEILGGRVKTLHPMIHGGLLATQAEEQQAELKLHHIERIDLLVVNLYPFRETISQDAVIEAEALEMIDIGGPTMIRAAAKNYLNVLVVVDPTDYEWLADTLPTSVDQSLRRRLARKAFAHTAAYDAAIVGYFDREVELPDSLHLALERASELRYGENPHQQAARYHEIGKQGFWDTVIQHKGMALSYLNIFDAEAAQRLVYDFNEPTAVIIKHANPCGLASAKVLQEAYERAFACDPKSAFGGIVAFNRKVDASLAQILMTNAKADLVIAPGYEAEALAVLMSKRKAMRVMEASAPQPSAFELRRIDGGFLVQAPDSVELDRSAWQVVSERQPTEAEWRDMRMANAVCARTSSNAIVLVKDQQAVAVAAGQQSRVDAAEIAVKKAAGRAVGGVCASDAFFPFRDGLDTVAQAGITAVIQPGGSVRDPEIVAAANEHGMALVLTGERHFRH